MAEPQLVSLSPSPPNSSWLPEADPSLDEASLSCREPAPSSLQSKPSQPAVAATPAATTPPAIAKLLSLVPPPLVLLPPRASASATPAGGPVASPSPPETNTSAQRTLARSGIAAYADAGITSSHDTAYAGAAVLKGHDPKTGVDLELLSVSAQVGGENEVQAGLLRVGVSGSHGSSGAEFLTARAGAGAHNDDGSVGFNAGASATAAGVESTLSLGDGSLTLGLAWSVGASLSVGVRDIDVDTELCVKASYGPLTLGFCARD
jgi:hypothetical protein